MSAPIEAGGFTFEPSAVATPVAGGWLLPAGSVRVTHPFGASRYYRHGWHSWSLAHWADLSGPPHVPRRLQVGSQADDAANLDESAHGGSWVGAVAGPGGTALVLGALGLDARVAGDDRELRGIAAGEPCEWFVGYGPAEETLEAYARALGERHGNAARDPGRVWCSWYSYYRDVTEPMIDEVLGGLAGLDFDVVQIDDGWQVEVGDWQANDDFPSGMEVVAQRIVAAGYQPGLWLAPFIAHERSRTFQDHPDWFVADADGDPVPAGHNWDGHYYGLDLTRPDVRDHVAHFIGRAVDWGYAYLKLDFLFAAALSGARSTETTREQAYRSGIEWVRNAAGDDVYLLACGSPIVPSIGVFDGMRIGPDVAPWWENEVNRQMIGDFTAPGTRNAISTSLSRLWLQPVIATDPDVAYFRTRYNLLKPHERQLLADLCLIARYRATSDPPHWLDPEERSRLAGFLTAPAQVERLDRHRFVVDGREVDFSAATLDHRPGASGQ